MKHIQWTGHCSGCWEYSPYPQGDYIKQEWQSKRQLQQNKVNTLMGMHGVVGIYSRPSIDQGHGGVHQRWYPTEGDC